ncbi:isoprenoid synthase domain-containing protein [Aspergillus cavernicola]|uniref:Isoprenoid synthase domain-containing protein n=1 Tax=Aspergillus cavernicola TaxID=176166 RepID=A0ABR4IHG0_9EURO
MDEAINYCRHCRVVDPRSYKPPPVDLFCAYPMYVSNHENVAIEASRESLAVWNQAADEDMLSERGRVLHACLTPLGNYSAWAYPETLPDRLGYLTAFCDFAYYWDDVTDVLTPEKTDEVSQDLALVILSELKLGQQLEPNFKINKLGQGYIRECMAKDPKLGFEMVMSWQKHLSSAAKSTHNDMSFEQFLEHRYNEAGPLWATELGCWAANIECSREEKEEIHPIVRRASSAGVMANDYYSFIKEFDDHTRTGTLDRMQNGVGLLMREYGYTEEEARNIYRQEINKGEHDAMDRYAAWEKKPGPKSNEVRRYIIMTFQLVSGTVFWMAHAPRYHRDDLTTTAEDRATIIGKCKGPLRVLEGYPPPKGVKRVGSALDSSTTTNKRRSNTNNHNNQVDGGKESGFSSMALFTAPFVAAPSHVLEAPYEYINALQSKNMRNKFIDTLNSWLRVPSDSLQIVKNIVQMLHNSSLMLDDIEDISSLRRGQPATHIFYGTSQTINSANFTYVKTVHETTKLRNPKCIEIFINELSNLHRGQSLDLHWRHHASCPSTDDYIMMVDNKTGGLFRLMSRLMEAESSAAASSSSTSSLARLLSLTGRYYQIRDDYLNLTSADYTSKKGFCEDLDEGKFSLPLIHLLNHTPYPDRITSAIYNRACATKLKREVKQHILDAMESARTFEYVRDVLKHLHAEIMKSLGAVEAGLGTNIGARVLLLGLAL